MRCIFICIFSYEGDDVKDKNDDKKIKTSGRKYSSTYLHGAYETG